MAAATGPQRQFLEDLGYEGDLYSLSKQEASYQIDRLLAQRKERQRQARQAEYATKPKAEPGYYIDGDNLYVVVMNQAGTGCYAKQLVVRVGRDGSKNGKWEYRPGTVFDLAGLERLTAEEAARVGHLHGFCVICCLALEDPVSCALGMGPVCWKKVTGVARPKLSPEQLAERLAGLPQFAHLVDGMVAA